MIHGIFGRPFLDLAPLLDLTDLAAVHDEVCLGLAQAPSTYTGGSHRSMGIMPASREREAGVDYGAVLADLGEADRRAFASLADDPLAARTAGATEFGEERPKSLSRRQQLWLEYRFGVYFPWKVYYEMIPNHYWDEKSSPAGKAFTREARTFFPKTIALVKSLPFQAVGRCNVMGLRAHDHGTVHRDGDPVEKAEVDHFITICPAANKRLFLCDEAGERRVDGVFEPGFERRVRELAARGAS